MSFSRSDLSLKYRTMLSVRRSGATPAVAMLIALIPAAPARCGPNLMAIGNYAEMPFKRAEGRDSFSGKVVVFSFSDPEFNFGRVVVRSSQPSSIVRRDLFVGFTGDGLIIDASGGGGLSNVALESGEYWLRVQGKIRGGKKYAWELETPNEIDDNGINAFIPVVWADGKMIGAEVTIKQPEGEEDRIQRLLFPHGVVTMPEFTTQTGGAWVVIPFSTRSSGGRFLIQRFSLREVDEDREAAISSSMPTPVRYISIRNAVEDQIAGILERSALVLKNMRTPEYVWDGGNPEATVTRTADVVGALAELDPTDEELALSIEWLAEQEPEEGQSWGVGTVASQLFTLARFGDFEKYRAPIQRQVEFLIEAQQENGGWGATTGGSSGSRGRGPAQKVETSHENSFSVLLALREAAFAGAHVDRRAWRGVLAYWSEARSYDGGFTRRVSGLEQATTTSDTAMGAAAIMTAVDASTQLGARRCGNYRGSARQLRHVTSALQWLDEHYKDYLRDVGSLVNFGSNPYLEAAVLQILGAVSGITHFNDKDHFVESAQELVKHFDPATGLFGLRGQGEDFAQPPSVEATTAALGILGLGAAPSVCQRLIVGDDEEKGLGQYSGDVAHLVRYLAGQRGRQFNWRRASIDDPVRKLAETPIMLVNVKGPFEWSEEQWATIRDYVMSGGSVVFDIPEQAEAERTAVLAGLQKTFPEYAPAPLPADHPLFSSPQKIKPELKVQAIGNGFRDFVFLPAAQWSCHFEVYDVKDNEASFQFMNNLLSYCLDGAPPPNRFAPSSYPVSTVASHSMNVLRLETGGDRPAYPDLVDTVDRLMRSNYRTAMNEVDAADDADVLLLSVTGEAAMEDSVAEAIRSALRAGRFIMADVVSGNTDWDETFRGRLRALDSGITLEVLPRNDPVFTGEIAGTQGFDVVSVAMRRALHTRFSKRGRCALYRIRYHGRPAGVYSAHDLSSGVAHHMFPDCRGVMPRDARRLMMNAMLTAYAWKLRATPGA